MLDGLFKGPEFLKLALDGLTTRGEAITENLANTDTPHYKRKEVAFEDQLRRIRAKEDGEDGGVELATTDPRHLTSDGMPAGAPLRSVGPAADIGAADFHPTVSRSTATSYRNDGNNVDIDYEMSSLAENEISYNAVADLMKRDFDRIRTAIKG